MAVDSTPERSFSLLLSSSRAAEATTGCGTLAEMRRRHHRVQRRLDRARWDRTGSWRRRRASCRPRRRGHAGSRRPGANGWSSPNDCGVRARPSGSTRMSATFWTSRTSAVAAADLEQRIVGGDFGIGRIEQKHAAEPRTPAGRQLPVLTLDVVDDRGIGPGQERRDDEADALPGPGRRKAQHMLRTVVAKIVVAESAKHDAIGTEKSGTREPPFASPSARSHRS